MHQRSAASMQEETRRRMEADRRRETNRTRQYLRQAHEENFRMRLADRYLKPYREARSEEMVKGFMIFAKLASVGLFILIYWLWGSEDEVERAEIGWRARYSFARRIEPHLR